MPIIDAVADLLLQTATVFRVDGTPPADFPVSDTGATQRTYTQVAENVPCKIFLWRPRSKGSSSMTQAPYGLLNETSTGGLFFLDAPIKTGDRIVVDGITYGIKFKRITYDDGEPSHFIVEIEREAVEPFLEAGAV